MFKQLIQKTLVIAILALGSGAALAQEYKTDVDMTGSNVKQDQKNKGVQELDIGNSKNDGTTKVKVTGTITQEQDVTDSTSKQTLKIGNADGVGSKSNVEIHGRVGQVQTGSKNTQTLKIGEATDGGQSKVEITGSGGIVQGQHGEGNTQEMDIGSASNGKASDVTISGYVQQYQQGKGNTQQATIGKASAGNTKVIMGNFSQGQTGSGGVQRANIGNAE